MASGDGRTSLQGTERTVRPVAPDALRQGRWLPRPEPQAPADVLPRSSCRVPSAGDSRRRGKGPKPIARRYLYRYRVRYQAVEPVFPPRSVARKRYSRGFVAFVTQSGGGSGLSLSRWSRVWPRRALRPSPHGDGRRRFTRGRAGCSARRGSSAGIGSVCTSARCGGTAMCDPRGAESGARSMRPAVASLCLGSELGGADARVLSQSTSEDGDSPSDLTASALAADDTCFCRHSSSASRPVVRPDVGAHGQRTGGPAGRALGSRPTGSTRSHRSRACSRAIWSRKAASAASILRASASTCSIWPSGITTAPEESANTYWPGITPTPSRTTGTFA